MLQAASANRQGFSGDGLGVCAGKANPGGFVPDAGGNLSLTSRVGRFQNS